MHTSSAGYDFIDFDNATAFGRETKATNEEATAFGRNTEASGITSTAFGESSTASGEAATAFGISSTASGKNSLAALGGTASAENAAAIGNGAQAKLADSVALGSGAVADRQSGAKGYDMLTKGETTNTSAVWVANANAIAIGNGSTLTRQITGVAAGLQDTDAVNVAQLKAAGFKVTTQKNDAISSSILNGDTLDFEAKDNAIVSTSKDSKTITVAVSRTPTFDSATFYNPNPTAGQNNEKVTIANGQISAFNSSEQKRAVIGVDNEGNGNLSLVNNDLSTVQVYTQNSQDKGNDDITRMYYVSSSGNGGEVKGIHTIAVLDDGINYAGDNVKPNTSEKVVVKHKLNSTMDVTGGADTSNLSEGNIGVVATPAVEDEQGNITQKGKLEIKLNKDVTGLNTVTAGTAKIGHNDAGTLKTTQNGAETGKYADAGDYVTGLTNKDWTTNNPTYVSGRAATEDELATVSGDVTKNANNITNNATNIKKNADTIAKGLSFTTNTVDANNKAGDYQGYKVVNRQLGDTISIKAGDVVNKHHYATTNLTTEIADNGDITIKMDENPTFNVVTATSVNLNPKDNTTKDQNGKTASAQLDAHYRDGSLNPDKNVTMADGSTGMVRLHYHDGERTVHDLATMDDGQIYAGDIKTDGTEDTTGFGRKMNEKTTINGGVKEKDNLTDNNIGVVSNGTDTLTVKLAKDLKNLNSVTTGKTVLNDSGITITNDAHAPNKTVAVKGDEVTFGGNQVTNMGSGINTVTNQYDTLSNGANIGDVKNIANSTTDAAKLTGDSNITVTYNDAAADGKNTVKLNDSITLGSDAGKKVTIDGTAGTITAGDKVSFDGNTGKGNVGGVTIGNQTGVATTKMDGGKAKTEDGTFVTGLTNKVWNPDANGIVSGRAATEDQLKTVSDTVNAGWELDVNGSKQKDVTPTSRKVNFKQGQNIIISGSGDDVTVATDDTVRFTTINVTGDKDASGSYTGGITIGKQSGGNSANPGPGYYITGLDNTSWNSAQIQSGRAATEDQLKQVAEDIKHGTVDGDKYITGGNATYAENGDGSAKLTGTNGLEGTISNLHDYYVTKGEVSDDGKKLTMTKNDGTTFDVDLGKVMQSDMRLVKNPARTDGAYTVDNDGNLTLTVQDANGTEATKQTITLSGLASKAEVDKGLNFAANSGTAYNAKLDGTVTIKGSDAKAGHEYSADNLTTEVDANGNITIKMDKDLTANTVTVSGKDGRDGQIGITGKDGADGTVTTIIKTIGKNGADGKNGTPGVNGTDGITRIVYQDGKDGEAGTTTHTVATLDDGLKFGANTPVAGKTANPVGNKLNSTINIKGAGTKNLEDYSGQNLLTSVEQAADGTTTINVLMDKNISADSVVVGQAGKDGKDGYIGINGKDGADGITTTTIRTEKGQPGDKGATGKPGVDGTDITRIVYQNGTENKTVATLDDGLKFSGDDNTVIRKKLNEQLQFVGGADKNKLTQNNIGINELEDGKLTIQLVNTPNLGDKGNLKAGDAQIGWFARDTLVMTKDGTNPSGNKAGAGSYAAGLSNTEWNVDAPEYVSGRAATEDQLKKVSDAIGRQVAAKSDYRLVKNDKTQDGSYTPENGTLQLQVKDPNNDSAKAETITIKDIASKSKVDEALDRTVKYDMKNGKVDKTHITFEGTDDKGNPVDTQVSHMASGASEIQDDGKGNKTYVYNTNTNAANIGDVKNIANSLDAEVTKKGLNFKGNAGQEVHRDLGATLNIVGGINDPKALDKTNGTTSSKNLGVRKSDDNSLEIVMTDTPDFEKVTIGRGIGTTQKIIIGEQTVTGKKADGSASETSQTGNYITGLDNKAWDKDNVVENRAATEGQLRDAINSVNGSVDKGFGLADEAGATVTKKLGDTVKVKGDTVYNADGTVAKDGNIKTTVKDGAIQISLNDQISVGQNGKDGKVTVETKGGTTVVVGHNGADGDNGKDGLFVTGKDGKVGIAGEDGKDAVSISGTGGVGHIGLTGPKGEKGADGTPGQDGISIDITTDLKSATLDDGKNVKTVIKDKDDKETTIIQAPRIQYDSNGKNYEVATMDDGLKIGANAAALGKTANPVSNKLNSTINIMGSAAKAGHTYTDDNLTTTVEQDPNGNTTVKVLMDKDITGNSVTVGEKGEKGESGTPGKDGVDGTIGVNGKDGSSVVIKGQDGISINGKDGQNGVTIKGVDGKAGTEGHIGLIGPKGPKGADGKDGQNASADIHVKNGQVGVDGTDGNKGTNGMDRVVYEDHNHVTHEVATMDDGLKFAGDDVNTTVAKKLNSTLQIRGDGTYDKEKNTVADDGNIKTSVDNGAVKVSLSDKINLHQDGYLTVGGSKNGNAADGNDPIVIKHFDDQTLDVITGVDKEGKPIIAKEGKAGDYVTGLDNKNWNVDKPEYVSGRAATEDQLKTISDAVKEAATTAGKHTVVTVENGKAAGTTDYNGENLKLKVTEKDGQKTYDLKLNDKVTLGKDGVDGTVGLKGADGKSSIGLNGKDGISVIGTDGKNGVSITGSNGLNGENGIDGKIAIGTPGKDGQPGKDAVSISGKDGVGHIGLTGQKGADGKDGAFTDLSTILGTATLDRNQNEVKDKDSTKDKASRIQYQTTVTTEDGKTKTITHEVATMDDGLKFVGNDGKEVAKKLNSTLSLTGGMDKDAVAKASSKNLGVRSNAKGDGLELVMTDTPDFTKVTVGEGTDTTQKIIIGKQTVTGKKSDGTAGTAETGKYITGLDNTKWNEDNVVENRAATEGQLRDVAGSITNQSQGGGFGLADEAGNTVKKDLGQTVTVKGDGKNIETKVANGSLEVSLKKDVDLGGNGSINAGQTKVDQNGVDTNKVTIKDSGINISKDGINGGGKQITNIASGIDGKTYADAKDNNAASIGDVKNIAGKVEQNVTNVTNNVNQIGQHVDKLQTDVTQLQQDVKADRQYQGDDAATKKSVNVKFGRFLSLTGGAKVEALADEGNLGVIQQEREDPDHKGEKLTGLSIRLAKDLKGLNSVEANTVNAKTVNSETFQAGNTTINNGGLTVKGDDKHKDITIQQGTVNMGGNKIEGVAPGKVAPDSTEAINGSQLAQRDQAIGKLGGAINNLDRRVDRVGAGAAALAALHPQDFDPDDKWDFAVGYGNYRGANAAAVGAFYRPNEDTTLSVGGTVGGGENMVNAGISFKFGQGNHVTNSRVAMAKEILALKDYVQKQDEKIEKLEALVGQQGTAAAPKRRSILFPDVPENHWAYAYVKKLADRGLLEGYPDGEFKGDRTITRYEFAALFSRALENGASVDNDMERMSEEFEPEIRELSLNRFRVDRVEGKDNDRHKIERVRVNDRDELVKQKNGEQKKRYRDLYGSVIEKDAPADAAK